MKNLTPFLIKDLQEELSEISKLNNDSEILLELNNLKFSIDVVKFEILKNKYTNLAK